MNKTLRTLVGIALFSSILVGAPMKAYAQPGGTGGTIPSLELDQADVRDALRIIFRTVGANYSIDPLVQGTVTLSIRDVPFETALRNVLNQVGATYRVEAGIYVIFLRPTADVAVTTPGDELPTEQAMPIRRIRLRAADPFLIVQMLLGESSLNLEPESSAFPQGGMGGGGFGGGGFGGGGFGGGGFGGGGFGGGGFGGGGFGGGGFGGGGFGGGGMGGGGFGGGGFGGGGMGGGGFGGGGRGGFGGGGFGGGGRF